MIAEGVIVLGFLTVLVKMATRKKQPPALPPAPPVAKAKKVEEPNGPYRTAGRIDPEPEPEPEEEAEPEPEEPQRATRKGTVHLIDRSVTVQSPPEMPGRTGLVAYALLEERDRTTTHYEAGATSGDRREHTTPRTTTGGRGCMFFLETKEGRVVVDARNGFRLEGTEKLLVEEELTIGKVFSALAFIDDIERIRERSHESRRHRHAESGPTNDIRRRVYGITVKAESRVEVTGMLRPPASGADHPFPTLEGPNLVIRRLGKKAKRREGDFL